MQGINIAKSYLYQCYKEPNHEIEEPSPDHIDISEQSSPGLSLSKLSKHNPRSAEVNGCGKKWVKIVYVKLTYEQS